MILLDSDVLIDLLRKYPPAAAWFNALHGERWGGWRVRLGKAVCLQ